MTSADTTDETRSERSEHHCMAPWVGLHISATGELKPCCEYDASLGDANQTSLEDYWRGRPLAEVRERLARGEEDPGCWKCTQRTRSGARSVKDTFNEQFSHHEARVEDTQQGRPIEGEPVSLDLRFSNLCNLRCRTCWHGASSRWFADAEALPYAVTSGPRALIRSVEDPERVLAFVAEHARDLQKIYFAGGEPLIMEEHYAILEELDRQGLHHVHLAYNTNFTELRFRGIDVLELWGRFERVSVSVSVDGIEARGELIRKDLSWDRLVANRARMIEQCPDVDFDVNTVVSVLNLFHLPELQRHLVETGFARLAQMNLSLAQTPPIYSIQLFPRRMKRRAEALLREHIGWLRAHPENQPDGKLEALIGSVEAAIHYMNAESGAWIDRFHFAHYTPLLDAVRSESLTEVAPELAPLIRGHEAARVLHKAWERFERIAPGVAARISP